MIFKDRQQAGNLLAGKLSSYARVSGVVIGLARGGVQVAASLAQKLELPVDVLVVKKIGSPYDTELAVGAITPDHTSFINWRMAQSVGADEVYINQQTTQLQEQVRVKTLLYRKGMKPYNLREKTVILVDDGIATGATFEAAIKWLKTKKPKKIIAAIPVSPPELVAKIKPEVDELMVLEIPNDFSSVGQWYQEFPQVTDEEVKELLNKRLRD